MSRTILLGLLLAAWGCGGPNIDLLKARAAHDMNCGEDKIEMTALDEDGNSWGLRGCDKEAAYTWSTESGKEEWVMTKKPESSAPPSGSAAP